jgi:hypothetical protein
MSEPDKTLPPRKTAAVTIAGALLLLLAVGFAYVAAAFAAHNASGSDLYIHPYSIAVSLALAVVLALAGLAIVCRWRGWRIWAGTIAWGLIALVVLNLFRTPPPPGTDRSFELRVVLGTIAFAVFVLVVKRRERKLDLRAVFD